MAPETTMSAIHDNGQPGHNRLVDFRGTALLEERPPSNSDETSGITDVSRTKRDCINIIENVQINENARMKICWDSVMCKELKVPEGYQDVAVLIIKWAEELDQLKSGEEVRKLDELFQQRFHYRTKIVELPAADNLDIELMHAIVQFVRKHDGTQTLLIVYYTGHASYHDKEEYLKIHASDQGNNERTSANWKVAHTILEKSVKADVLGILDTCYASNLFKHQQPDNPRTYELFCASGYDKATAGPGPKSFTTALIGSLETLLEKYKGEPFTTRELAIEVGRRKERRKTQPFIWPILNRFDSFIALAPLNPATLGQKEEYNPRPVRAELTLRLALTEERLTEPQTIKLSQALCQAIKKIKAPVKRVHMEKLYATGERNSLKKVQKVIRSIMAYKHLRNLSFDGNFLTPQISPYQMEHNMDDPDINSEQSPISDSTFSGSSGGMNHIGQASHKRKHTQKDNEVEEPTAKRRVIQDPVESCNSSVQTSPLTPNSEP